MRRKILGVLVCMLLIATAIPTIGSLENNSINKKIIRPLSGWYYRKEIVINHSQVVENLVNFPILVKMIMNTSHVQNDADDIFFTSVNGTRLNHEIEYYNDLTGELTAWVNVSSLSSSVDIIVYVYYGNSVCSSQQNPKGTWDSNYITVFHLKESSGTIYDSTDNYNGLSVNIIYQQTGMVDGCIGFTGSTSYVDYTDNLLENRSLELWANFNSLGNDNIAYLAYNPSHSTYALSIWGGGLTSGKVSLFTSGTSMNNFTTSVGLWNYYALTYNYSDGKGTAYINGSYWDSRVGWANDKASNQLFGYNNVNAMSGIVDEFRLSKVVRSSAWIKTSYNTISSPLTFTSIGEEEYIGKPPETPNIIGPSNGTIGVSYNYNFVTTDPENDNVYYKIDWGDGSPITGWLGSYASGQLIIVSHTFSKKGTYVIKCQAKDTFNTLSDWGTLSVIMPLTYEPPHFRLFIWLFDRLPYAFPILRQLLGY